MRTARPPRSRRAAERARGPRCIAAVGLAIAASLAWFELPVSALGTTVGPPDRPPPTGGLEWLSTRAGHIVDTDGRTVLLRGFNTSALLEGKVLRSPFDAGDASLIEREGFDVVRVAVSWGRLEPQRGHWDTSYLDQLSATVRLLTAHHVYAVIDMHFLDWSAALGGSGAPAWATLPLFPTLHISALGDWQRHLSPSVVAATSYFWLAPDWQADYIAAWQHIAARFRDDSAVAGYDLFNEPHSVPLPPIRFERDLMWPLYARTIDGIGAVDPNHLFIVEGQLLGDFGTTVVPLRAPDLVYSPHEYTGSLVPPSFDGNAAALDAHVSSVAAEARQVPAALWVGEWGMGADQARVTGWIDDAIDAFDAAGAGWAWWQWREDSPWGVRDTAGTVATRILLHLARPYLAAAPAGVHAFGADGVNGALSVTVDSVYAGGPIEVAWPSLTAGTPAFGGTCTGVPQWDPVTARLVVTVDGPVPCTMRLTRAP